MPGIPSPLDDKGEGFSPMKFRCSFKCGRCNCMIFDMVLSMIKTLKKHHQCCTHTLRGTGRLCRTWTRRIMTTTGYRWPAPPCERGQRSPPAATTLGRGPHGERQRHERCKCGPVCQGRMSQGVWWGHEICCISTHVAAHRSFGCRTSQAHVHVDSFTPPLCFIEHSVTLRRPSVFL